MCEYPGCQRLFMRGFRFRSVLKSDPREKLRRSCLRPSADKTKLPVAREKQPLVPRVMCEWKPHSEKEKNKEKNLAKTREKHFQLNLNHQSLQLPNLVSFYGVIMDTFSASFYGTNLRLWFNLSLVESPHCLDLVSFSTPIRLSNFNYL